MQRKINNRRALVGQRRGWHSASSVAFTVAVVLGLGGAARAQNAESPAQANGSIVARILPPAEKIKVLEDELAKEVDKRMKVEEENSRRITENADLLGSLKTAQKDRAGIESRLTEAREREVLLQRTNDRLREETERVTVSVRLALPVIAGIAIIILALLVWMLLFLRQVAARVHGQRTLSEMHELEGRLIHTNDLLNAELKRTQALRQKLGEFGISS
jgi:hypothetical protein